MVPAISSYNAASGAASQHPSSTSGSTPNAVDKNMFMRLMIAQLRNQDPMNPSDGTQFVAQLAQFQQLEESVNSGQDLTAIRRDLDQLVAALNSGANVSHS
jgi:flagellar basal-body rod modification protein FlgD